VIVGVKRECLDGKEQDRWDKGHRTVGGYIEHLE